MNKVGKIGSAAVMGLAPAMLSGMIGSIVYGTIDKPLVEVHPILAKYDENHDERLSYKEAFNLLINLDTNKDGYLSEEELAPTKDLFENDGTIKWFPLYYKNNVMKSSRDFWTAYSQMMNTQKGDLEKWLSLRQKEDK